MIPLILTLHYQTTTDLQNNRRKQVKYLSDGHNDVKYRYYSIVISGDNIVIANVYNIDIKF